MNVQGKTIVVTGAGSGIGRELVFGLLARGANVAAVDIHDSTIKETKELAGAPGQRVSLHVLNIADQAAVEVLPKNVVKAHGAVDGIINNAGIIQPFVKVNELGYDDINRVFNVNFFGTLYMTKAFLPLLLKRPEAYIMNISSMGGFLPVPGQSVYGASKAAVKLLTEGLFAELSETRVHVTVVFPGATATNITTNSGVQGPKMPDTHGKKPSFTALPAKEAARIILTGMEKNKPQIFVGQDSRMMNLLYRLNPISATNLIAKKMRSLLTK